MGRFCVGTAWRFSFLGISQTEIFLCVVVAHVAHNLSQPFFIIWKLSVLYVFANLVAKYPSEILMSRERKETAAIGKHTDKATQQSHVRQGVDLFFHSIFLIEEPPCGPKL